MASLSGIVSGPIAYGTSFLDGRNRLNGWQYLFILEGVPTIILSIVSYFCLFDSVDEVSWLTESQKRLQHERMERHVPSNAASSSDGGHVSWDTLIQALTDWKTWLFAVVYIMNAVNFSSYSIFTPVIIDGTHR